MSHEIYYTSAPEGIKRGSGGFCTVAASENLPKALWDRLETLSAYRHHFSVNDAGGNGAAGGAAQNPVSCAHSILSVMNRSYHVLSRICDSGVDHTQRTNAFAHHLVVETAEMDAAAGGPAWLLGHFGVMRSAWDGQVGSLPPRNLPRGDAGGSKICNAWAAATGDAGWGGHLADLFVKAPARPVCILFEPGQDLLPLIAESLALLPAAARWNVTFNTYFTSMPTSATCLWRCCVAGTPAGQLGVRYAANGLIVDLTARQKLGSVPAGALVTVARTGQMTTSARPAAVAGVRPKSVVVPAAKAPAKAGSIDPEGDLEEEELEKQRAAILEIAPESGEIPLADLPGTPETNGPAGEGPQLEDLAQAAKEAQKPLAARADGQAPARAMKKPKVKTPARVPPANGNWDESAARRRRQVMMLFGGALVTMAVGTALVYVAARRNKLPEEVESQPKGGGTSDGGTTVPQPQRVDEGPAPKVRENPTNVPPEGGRAARPVDNGVSGRMASTPPRQEAPPAVVPQVTFADVVALTAAMEKPNVGNGIGERYQGLPLRMAEVDRPAGVTGLRVMWPARVNGGGGKEAVESFSNDAFGVLSTAAVTRAGKPGVAVRFKARGEPTGLPAGEVVFIGFDRARPGVDLTWRPAMLLKYPELFSFVFWTLQNSTLELQGARTPAQRVAFKRSEIAAVSLRAGSTTIPWPAELPRETTVLPPKITQLPSGWEATWYTSWEETDASKRTAANALQVIRFKKPTVSPVTDAWFLLTFRPGGGPDGAPLSRVESTFAKRLASDLADKEKYESDLKGVLTEIEDAKKRSISGTLDPQVESTREIYARRDSTAQLAAGFEAAVAAYHELKEFEVQFQSDGVTLATVRFQQADKAETGK